MDFDKNIATSRDSIVFSDSALTGVPDDLKQNWKRPNGDYVLYINTPNAIDISKNAASEDTRKKMYFKYTNRAYPQNFKVLDHLLYYRQQYAVKLGYNSYAAYALTDKMAGNPQSVWQFENNLVAKLTPTCYDGYRNHPGNQASDASRTPGYDLSPGIFQYYKKQLLDHEISVEFR